MFAGRVSMQPRQKQAEQQSTMIKHTDINEVRRKKLQPEVNKKNGMFIAMKYIKITNGTRGETTS